MKKTISATRWLLLLSGLLLFSSSVVAQNRTITGTVIDDKGETLPFVSVYIPGSTSGTQTDMNGRFSLTVPQNTKTIEASFIGFKKKQITLDDKTTNYDIRLEPEAVALEAVVVVGNVERKKESFTGAFNTVGGSELKQVGSSNLVESLKALDPSFVVMEDMAMGANPNAMPTIEVRGQTSITTVTELEDAFTDDPNQPLFILDGFETSLQKIIDLDPNRIENVSVLKDAASTAFYGSRAANGVVVVTTIKGEPGRFRVFYTGDYSVQLPNLSSYNMMNAEEKLEFERRSGRYDYMGDRSLITNITAAQGQANLDSLYYSRLADVRKGVNSYWMSDPLQTPLTHRQSIRFNGGSKELMVNAAISYKNAPGLMKGSKRDSWGADLDLNYNTGKFSFVNQLSLSGYMAQESSYGAFSDWVGTNPYYRKTDTNGEYPRILDSVMNRSGNGMVNRIVNPLYVASLNSKNETKGTTIDERFNARWNFYEGMRLEGMFQLSSSTTDQVAFSPPEDPQYDEKDPAEKGNYTNTVGKMLTWTGNLMYVWSNLINDKHSYIVNIRGEMSSTERSTTRWEGSGFPPGTNGNPSYANNYIVNGKPYFSNPIQRRANFLASVNYSYANRYLFDATFREDGSTVFGAAKKYTPFWSTGIGWNLHEENFLKKIPAISLLRLRATIGQVGNQNVTATNSSSIYTYVLGGNVFGPGAFVSTIGNPNVEWQKTMTSNVALDLNLFDNRFVSKFEVYQKRTSPLVVAVDQAPSTGVTQFPMSLGNLTYRGLEFEVSYVFIRTKDVNWRVKVMGSSLIGEYSGFGDKLAGMDAAAQNSKTLQRYRDGYNQKTLWAMRSLGIDPATGREMYLTADGQVTPIYDASEVVAIGNGEPKLTGIINNFLTYKNITLSCVLRYRIGEQKFNNALYSKVENITIDRVQYNQDRRALNDRWYQPGDLTQFKNIRILNDQDAGAMSSRFIQTENLLAAESIGITWRCDKKGWIRHLRLERLDFTATATGTSGVFRLSNLQLERGTSYPEATIFSLSVNAAF